MLAALTTALVLATPAGAALDGRVSGDDRWFLQLEGGTSLLNDQANMSILGGSVTYGARGGYRLGDFGFFLQVEQNLWLPSDGIDTGFDMGVLNVGVGVGYRVLDERVRLSFAVGTSTLLFDTVFDDAGTTGVFVDLRPASIRWNPAGDLVIELHPFTFSMVHPVTGDPGIRLMQYRTVLTLEYVL